MGLNSTQSLFGYFANGLFRYHFSHNNAKKGDSSSLELRPFVNKLPNNDFFNELKDT